MDILPRTLLRLLLRLSRDNRYWDGRFLPGSVLALWSSVDEVLRGGIVSRRRRRYGSDVSEYFVKVIGELVATGVDVNGGVESLYENGLFYEPLNQVVF